MKKMLIIMALISILGCADKNKQETLENNSEKNKTISRKEKNDRTQNQPRGIEDIKDLIDGQYQFDDVNTDNWKVYRNERMGFEVKHPQNWYVDEEDGGVCLRQKDSNYSSEGLSNLCGIKITGSEKFFSNKVDLRSYVKGRKKDYDSNILSLSIDNTEAIYIDNFGAEALFFNESKKWSIFSILNKSAYPEVFKVFPGILKTFEFIEKKDKEELIRAEYDFNDVNTDNWKTYRNQKMGFEMKIPKTWDCGIDNNFDQVNNDFIYCKDKEKKDPHNKNREKTNNHNINYDILYIDTKIVEKENDFQELVSSFSRKNKIGKTFYSVNLDQTKSLLIKEKYIIKVLTYSKNKNWTIRFSTVTQDYKSTLDGMLKTFKFID